MKKINIFSILFLMLLPVLAGCSKDEIVFDSELPRFELRPGYQLLEVIVPQGTLATDKIYIIGDFNGGMEAVGDPRWQLEKASDTDVKWGVYLNPADFVEGKTLADGYTFYSVEQGEERSLENTPVVHTKAPDLGERLNVIVNRWAAYFNKPVDPEEIEHDGYAIFVVNNSGWEELYLYMWGTVNDLNGAWPGMSPTGTQVINDVTYTYFDLGAANCDAGLEEHVILNNGNGKQIDDVVVFALDRDVYVELTATGAVEIDPATYVPGGSVVPEPEPEPGPAQEYKIYVQNLTGWSNFNIYAWGDKEIFGAWPGMSSTETVEIGGVTYLVFTVEGSGEAENLIFNDGNGAQYDAMAITLDKDYYIVANPDGASIVEPSLGNQYKIYIEDKTGWGSLYVYAWGDKEIFGGWPGMQPDATETIDGVTYKVLTVEGNGETENLIFNDGNGVQYDAATITLDKDYTIVANSDKAEVK